MNVLLVFVGGGLGSVLRYFIGIGFHKSISSLPIATFISNITACLIFSLSLWFISMKGEIHPSFRLLLLTGFCGGLSTFSTFGFETWVLLREGMMWYALLNIFVSTICGLLMFYLINK
jgi:fluoride exporter